MNSVSPSIRTRKTGSTHLSRLLLIVSVALGASVQCEASDRNVYRSILLWNESANGADSLDQQAFEVSARCAGYSPVRLTPARLSAASLESTALLIVPHATAALLTPTDIEHIKRSLEDGLCLITDGRSPLGRALGLRLGKPEKTSRIRDRLRPELHLAWADSPRVPWIAQAPSPGAKAIYIDRANGHPLCVVLQVGRGRCLYLAPLFDPQSGLGYRRFPTLLDAIVRVLGCSPLFDRRAAESYFDPGYRADQSIDSLAAVWKRWGMRAIHAAAWYAMDDPPFDYKKLVDACHRNAILVYAWLEWPYIGLGFWERYPEWRQKNALLKDAHFDFLYLMDLQNPACMERALANLDSLLTLEWDGIDVAEFTLTGAGKQALEGAARPDWCTGFTDYCRAEFRKEEGFDPVELFNRRSRHYWRINRAALESFYRYRTRVNVSTQHRLFSELDRLNREQRKSWELMLTIVDNSKHPEFDQLLGFDLDNTLGLLKKFDVTLQVEDPYMEWTKPPQRYVDMGLHYRRLLGDRPFLFDVNIVPMLRERKRRFAAIQPVGIEVYQACTSALTQSDRICFYCESSVAEEDWDLMPFAMAAGAQALPDGDAWTINAPNTVHFGIPPGDATPFVDDQPWCAYDELGTIIPAGNHTFRLSREKETRGRLRLVAIAGELLNARYTGTGCIVEYASRPRCALRFNRRPTDISIDGVRAMPPTVTDDTTCTLLAPAGRHTVVIRTD